MTEEGKSLEAEVDVSADGGKDGENEVSDLI